MGKRPFVPPADAIVEKPFVPPSDAVVEKQPTAFVPPPDAEVESPTNDTGNPIVSGLVGLGKSAWNVAANQVPMEFKLEDLRNSQGTLASYLSPDKHEGDANVQRTSFDFPEANGLREKYNQWLFKQPDNIRSLDNEKRAALFLKQNVGEKGYQDLSSKFNTQLSDYRINLTKEIQQQKNESAELLKGVPQSITDVKSLDDFGAYLGQLAGQGVGRIASSILTGGTGSVIAERAAVYDRQLDQMAEMASKKTGISTAQARQNIIKLNQDNPEAGRTMADFAALLDIASIPTLAEGKVLGKAVPLLTEALTETAQSELEEKAATLGSGTKYQYDPIRSVDSFLGGLIGAGAVTTVTQAIANEDTGSTELNKTIDQAAGFTPADAKEYETKTGNRPTVQGIEGQNSEGTGSQESGSSGSIDRPQEIRSEENVTTGTPQEEGGGGQNVSQANAVQIESPGEILQRQQSETGIPGSERIGVEPGQQGQEATQQSEQEEKVTARDVKEQQDKVNSLFDEATGERGRGVDLEKLAQAKKQQEKLREMQNELDRQKVAREARTKQMVSVNAATALKEQMRNHYNKMKTEGVKKGQQLVNQLLENVTDTAKNFKLSAKQLTAVIEKIKKTNFFTPGSPGKVNAFIDKIANDAEYAEKLQTAKDLKAAVVQRGKSPLRDVKERSLVDQFKRINPEDVESIDDYNKLGESLKAGLKTFNDTVNVNEHNALLRDMVAKVYKAEFNVTPAEAYSAKDMLDQLEQRKEENTTNGHIDQLANEMGVDFDEAKQIYEEEEKGGNPKQLRDNLLEIANQKKVTVTSEGFRGKINDVINKIDPNLLTTGQLKRFITVVNRINENESYSDAGSVFAMGLAQEGWRNLKANPSKFKILNLNYLESKIDSLPLAIKAILGLDEVASTFQLYSGITNVSNVKDWATNAKGVLTEKLNKLHDTQREKGFTDESIFRQSIYGNLISYPEGMNPVEALEANKEIIKGMIDTYKQASRSKDAAIVSKLFKPFENATSIEEVQSIMEKVDPHGKKAINEIIDFFSTHKISEQDDRTILQALTDDNEMFHNEETVGMVNYSGARKWKDVGAVHTGNVEVEDLDAYSSNKPGKPKRLSSGFERSMKYQQGKVLDLNLHLNAINQAEQNVYSIVSKPYRLQVREFAFNQKDLMNLFGAEDYEKNVDRENLSKKEGKELTKKENNSINAAKLIALMFDGKDSLYHSFERTAMGQSDVVHNQTEKAALGLMSAIKSIGYGVSLSGLTQIVKQSTVLFNVGIKTGLRGSVVARAVEMTKNSEAASKFFSGETVNFRGSSHALLNTGDVVDKTALSATRNKVKKLIPAWLQSRFDGKIGWISGISPLLFGDVKSAKASYLAFYQQFLDKHGETYQGLEEENNLRGEKTRQEARAFAKHSVDVLQGVSNPAEQGQWFKNPNFVANVVRSFLVPYGHFASNTKARLYGDYVAVLHGNSAQKIEGAIDIMSTAAETVAFASTAQAARFAMLYTVGSLLAKTIGFPDKDDWEDFWEKAQKIVLKDMTFSNLPIILTQPVENGAVDVINQAYYGLLKMENEELTKKEYEKDYAPFTRVSTNNQRWYDYLGPYGASIGGAARAFELTDKGMNEELSDEQRKLALTAALAQLGQLFGLMPADVSNAIKATYFDEAKRIKTEESNGGGDDRWAKNP